MAKDPVCNKVINENKSLHYSNKLEESVFVLGILSESIRPKSSEIRITISSTEAIY